MWHLFIGAHRAARWQANIDLTIVGWISRSRTASATVLSIARTLSAMLVHISILALFTLFERWLSNSIWNNTTVHLLLTWALRWYITATHVGETFLQRIVRSKLNGLLFVGSWDRCLITLILLERVTVLRWKVYSRLDVLVQVTLMQTVLRFTYIWSCDWHHNWILWCKRYWSHRSRFFLASQPSHDFPADCIYITIVKDWSIYS